MVRITEKIAHLFERRLQERTDSFVNQKMQNLLHNVFYEPYMRSHDHYAFDEIEDGETVCELGMPVPPQKVMRKYAATPEAYLANGKQNTLKMFEIMKAVGARLDANSAILDFGCAAARMTRWLRLLGDGREYWGVDVLGMDVFWAKAALGKWLNIVTTTRLPHLPFEDGYFDFIFACSVFSHIDDLADAWALELRRVTRPGGYLFLTVMDETTIDLFQTGRRDHLERDVLLSNPAHIRQFDAYAKGGHAMFTVRRSQVQSLRPESPQTFYNSQYLQRHWGRFFDVVAYEKNAYGYQSAIVLRKRA